MKPNRDAAALAASLTSAASASLPLPQRITKPLDSLKEVIDVAQDPEPAQPKKPSKIKDVIDTVGISLRPGRKLWNGYVMQAAERTKIEGRVISAQEIMLEVLEQGLPQVKP
ncbi:MAG: hypothetical protein ACLPWS_00360 [Rhodomicrobium sp.]